MTKDAFITNIKKLRIPEIERLQEKELAKIGSVYEDGVAARIAAAPAVVAPLSADEIQLVRDTLKYPKKGILG